MLRERLGMEALRELANRGEARRELRARRRKGLARGLRVAVEIPLGQVERQVRRDQMLLRPVVQVSLEAPALADLGLDDAGTNLAALLLGAPVLGHVTDDRQHLVLPDADDPGLEVAELAGERPEAVVDVLKPPGVERALDAAHQRTGDVERKDLVHVRAEELVRRRREAGQVACELQVGAAPVETEHEVRKDGEERPLTRLRLAQLGEDVGQRSLLVVFGLARALQVISPRDWPVPAATRPERAPGFYPGGRVPPWPFRASSRHSSIGMSTARAPRPRARRCRCPRAPCSP